MRAPESRRAIMSEAKAPAVIPSCIPVNLITGALGAGKTTAIARLLAHKPAHESWVVILNEFTDTGIDTLTLAAAARGAYDLRMIPGGCLCCTGEEDFRRQLSGLLALPVEQQPVRILIEPSGIAHPGTIVEELRLFERSGALRLCSTIALLDAQQHLDGATLDAVTQAQVDAADVLLLAKADLVDEPARARFNAWAATLFPRKRFVACSERGVLPALALNPPAALFSFEPMSRPALHQRVQQPTHHWHAPQLETREVMMAGVITQAQTQRLLDREACGWKIPASVLFKAEELLGLLQDDQCWHGVERFKAVLRTGVDRWQLAQRWGKQHAITDCNWSQDSRIEVQLMAGEIGRWARWDQRWQDLSEVCPTG